MMNYNYYILYRYPPFHDDDTLRSYDKILSCNLRFPLHFDEKVRDLLSQLLTANISSRLGNLASGCLDIMEHVWFANIDFELLAQRKIKPPYIPNIKIRKGCTNDDENEHDLSSCYDVYEEEELLSSNDNDKDPFRDYFKDF